MIRCVSSAPRQTDTTKINFLRVNSKSSKLPRKNTEHFNALLR